MEVQNTQNFYGDVSIGGSGTVGVASTLASTSTPKPAPPAVKRMPFPSPFFTGRAETLKRIKEALCDPSRTEKQVVYVVHGLPGSGKTEITAEFASRHRQSFDSIYFIDSTSTTTISAAYRSIGYHDAHLCNDLDDEEMLLQVHDWLRKLKKPWLLIFDNAQGGRAINLGKFIPSGSRGRVIITTQNKALQIYAKPAGCHSCIGELNPTEAVKLLHRINPLERRKKDNARTISNDIVKEVGYLALAIVQAGSYITESTSSIFPAYLDMFRKKRRELMSRAREQTRDSYDRSVYATWDISFANLTADSTKTFGFVASEFIQICSFFYPVDISVEIFTRAFEKARRTSAAWKFLQHFADDSGDWDPLAFYDVTRCLGSHSLITATSETQYTIHSLVHKWTRDRLSKESKAVYMNLALQIISDSISWEDTTTEMDYRRTLIPHLLQLGETSMVLAGTEGCDKFSKVFREAGDWATARTLAAKVVERRCSEFGENHPTTLASKANLASAYGGLGEWTKAEKLQLKVLERRIQQLGEDHPDTLTSRNNLASTYWKQGRWSEAEVMQQVVMEKRVNALGEEDLGVLTSMSNLASTYSTQGNWCEAEDLEMKVRDLSIKKLGEEHPKTLTSMSNLATTYWNQGRWPEAEQLNLEVLKGRTRTLGEEHPDTLASMANLASTYRAQGHWCKAEELEIQVVQQRVKILGECHPDTLASMAGLASTYWNQSRWKDAGALQRKVLERSAKNLGQNHPLTLTTMGNLASTCKAQGRWNEAEELELKVMKLSQERFGEDHPDSLTSMANLSITYRHQGRLTDAEEMGLKVLEGRTKKLGEEHPDTLKSLSNLASIFFDQQRWPKAEQLQVNMLDRCRNKLGEDHPTTLTSMTNLAVTYTKLERLGDAEDLLVKAREKTLQKLGNAHPDTCVRTKLLGIFYANCGRQAEADALGVVE